MYQRLTGCQSSLWIICNTSKILLNFHCDEIDMARKGTAAIAVGGCDGHITVYEIQCHDPQLRSHH